MFASASTITGRPCALTCLSLPGKALHHSVSSRGACAATINHSEPASFTRTARSLGSTICHMTAVTAARSPYYVLLDPLLQPTSPCPCPAAPASDLLVEGCGQLQTAPRRDAVSLHTRTQSKHVRRREGDLPIRSSSSANNDTG